MLKLNRTKKDIPGMESLLVNFPTKSSFAESYRTLRTNIYFSIMEKDLKSLVVSSSLPGEGKTTTVANLAYTIAQTGQSVLMVDADLRKPGLTQRFGLQKATGLSNIVADVLGRHINTGRIEDYGLRDLIRLNSLQQRTCILNIADEINEVELYFVKGNLVDVYWKSRPESRKLASILVSDKLLTETEARLALGHQKKSAKRLGSVLLALGLMEEKDLNKILSVQMMEAFRVASEINSGQFTTRSVTEEEMQILALEKVNISQLASDFFSTDDTVSFIKKNIESNILETEEKNLFLLPAGTIPPNPSELIGSTRTSFLFKFLKKRFDVVIIDSSPIFPASDAMLLSSLVDGVVFVVQFGATNRSLAKDAIQQFKKAKANLLGVVLNKADMTNSSYYKYYQSYYGS